MARKQRADFGKDTVNLDALIPREDLRSKKQGSPNVGPIPVSELEHGKNQYHLLRKPIFQRATDDWTIDHVVSLIKSFRDGHLIPAVILWDAEGYTFVIDGAHRLSVFIAWINDDYGDQHISQNFGEIPKRQKEVAIECRRRVTEAGCTYRTLSNLGKLANRTEEQLRYSSNISRSIETQRIPGDSGMAATSFLAINQRSVLIDATERYFIEEEDAPNVVAARAIACNASGYAYWGKFSQENVQIIEKLSKQIYGSIFEPEDSVPKVDTELQPAGQARSSPNGVRIALDLVNIINDIKGMPSGQDKDVDGSETVKFLQRINSVIKYVAGNEPASLSLHPAVYFWGSTGNHRPSIFLAVASLVQDMIASDELREFTIVRARLEEFLLGNAGIGKQLLGKHGGWKKSVAPVKKLLRIVISGLTAGKSDAEIEHEISGNTNIADDQSGFEMQTNERNKWKVAKQHARIKASLDSAIRCAICKARLVTADASDDHVVRRADGGGANPISQLTHHYCNHGFKEFYAQQGMPLPDIASPV